MRRKVSHWSVGFGMLLASMALFQGCSDGANAPSRDMGKVSGTVTLDGKPLTARQNVQITFTPNEGGASASVIGDNGHYELEFSGGGQKGALVGMHTVSFHDEAEEISEEGCRLPGGDSTIISDEYTFGVSGIEREVVTGENIFDFELESDKE